MRGSVLEFRAEAAAANSPEELNSHFRRAAEAFGFTAYVAGGWFLTTLKTRLC